MLRVTDIGGPRFELALERLRSGHTFTFHEVTFYLTPDSLLDVSINTSWALENVTEQRAIADLHRAKEIFEQLLIENPEFLETVKNASPVFVLASSDGMGTIELARLSDGAVVWSRGFTP